jgi:hypothetical protein
LLELAELNNQIDRARWQLDAAEAVMDGRPAPPEPTPERPEACFFDPTHRRGTVEATIRTPAGEKPVKVCPECADKLRRGERPEPRMIDVGRRRVPAGAAPRTHGGGGFRDLLGPFSILLGGLAARGGLDFDWGGGGRSRPDRRSRREPGPGGPLLPGGSGSRSATRSGTGRSSRSGSSAGRRSTIGRGRRRR